MNGERPEPPVITRWEVTDAECEGMSWHDASVRGPVSFARARLGER